MGCRFVGINILRRCVSLFSTEVRRSDTTPWDAGSYQPALKEVLDDKALALPTECRALVPGCGRGYDAILIAKTLSLETLGIDVAPTAIAAAQE
ncbi:hypothetical protein DICSQDRAFT_136414 [Dichomitus squalens LYAD-421 SS1]|uniref:S-adenosyl-L-methionine-dependent methyltransferase n=1 Tax=Dichomitus squalens (strain LYAD-421) TaxID=732165 RepID=R7SZ98_DICSQ|nr:uncharacterized protein DICSQDRAFT_136414 [Dichomitus squalens LYAD-421 SS1]EJF61524.1 hypothetical protein DICSQDRAFT_136414 [Dichomitus squalens LYAD-421 SS1]